MINFRYHVVTLVAVFLALGVGVLFGSSFISENTVKALERAEGNLRKRNEALRRQVKDLDGAVDGLSGYAEASRALLVRNRLTGRPAVVISFESTPDEVVEDVEQTLVLSGARVDGSVRLSGKLDLSTETRREQLALALGVSTSSADELRSLLVQRLTESLSGRSPGAVQGLVASGLATVRQVVGGQTRGPGALASPGSAVVVLAPESAGKPDPLIRFIVPLVSGIAAAGGVVGVGEAGSKDLEVLAPLREDSAARLVTADGIEGAVGQTALVLGIEAAFGGQFGHYGSGKGASGFLPEPRPAAA